MRLWSGWTPCATWLTIGFEGNKIPAVLSLYPFVFFVNSLIVESLYFIVCFLFFFYFVIETWLEIVHVFPFVIVLQFTVTPPTHLFSLPPFCCLLESLFCDDIVINSVVSCFVFCYFLENLLIFPQPTAFFSPFSLKLSLRFPSHILFELPSVAYLVTGDADICVTWWGD